MADTQSSAQTALFTSSTSSLRYTNTGGIDPVSGQPIATPVYLVEPHSGAAILSAGFVASRIIAGQGFTVSTGQLTALGALTGGFGIFNGASSGKTLYIYDLRVLIGNNSFNQMRTVTTDPAFGTAITPMNSRIGSATASVATVSYVNSNQTPSGTLMDTIAGATNTGLQALQNGKLLILQQGTGLALYTNISGVNNWLVAASWYEV